MLNPFYRKLRRIVELTPEDEILLDGILGHPCEFASRQVVLRQGSKSTDIHLVVEGVACLERQLVDGSRLLSGLLMPGDLGCTSMEVDRLATHSVVALSPCSIIKINQGKVDEIATKLPRLMKALWRLSLADQSVAREWFVNVARRPASARMAHLFCEILARLQAVGLAENGKFSIPLTQGELGEMLGISSVHANRVLQELRAAGLVVFDGKYLEIPDAPKLKSYCHFTPDYLLMHTGSR